MLADVFQKIWSLLTRSNKKKKTVTPAQDILGIWRQLCKEYHVPDLQLVFTCTNELQGKVATQLATPDSYVIALTSGTVILSKLTKKTSVKINCVYLLCDHVYPHLLLDRNKYESRLNELTMMLRHEIGHAISLKEKYENLTEHQLNKLDAYIETHDKSIVVPSVANVYTKVCNYLMQAEEEWANEAAGIDARELASALVSFYEVK